MNSLKVFTKELFGHDLKKLKQSLLLAVLIFCSLYFGEFRLAIAPAIMYLMSLLFTAGIMLQVLSSRRNREYLSECFSLPFSEKEIKASLLLTLSSYVALTRTLPLLALLFALGSPAPVNVLICAEAIIAGCLFSSSLFVALSKSGHTFSRCIRISGMILLGLILAYGLFLAKEAVLAGILALTIVTAVIIISRCDVYLFASPTGRSISVSGRKRAAGVMGYMFRRMRSNPSYLANTLILSLFGILFPPMFRETGISATAFIGFGIMTINTPLCTMLSSDPDTETAVRTLPSQATEFRGRYCLFIFIFNMFLEGIYLVSTYIFCKQSEAAFILIAILSSLQAAILSAWLEWKHPILNWKVEPDLWHHPRKYIVPCVIVVIASLACIWRPFMYVWLVILAAESFIFFHPEKMPAGIRRVIE